MRKISYVVPVYLDDTSDVLIDLLKLYEGYSDEIKEAYEFIIVDDCSPIKIKVPDVNLNMKVLRIHTNITWNVGGAKNLGIIHSSHRYILATDLDFIYPENLLTHLMTRDIKDDTFYFIGAWNERRKKVVYWPHTIFTTIDNFKKVGYYDEIYSGNYGCEDMDIARSMRRAGIKQFNIGYKSFLFIEDLTKYPERGHHLLKRDSSVNRKISKMKKKHSGLYLNFEWLLKKLYFYMPENKK